MSSIFGMTKRPSGGSVSRFRGTSSHGSRAAAVLSEDHPAILGRRTLFRKQVKTATEVPRLLVGGVNSAKIGRVITKGDWAGMPVFTLTLEERKTCPETCHLWRECYGNAMPLARRVMVDDKFWGRMQDELWVYQEKYTQGFALRLHVLGDFPNAVYVSKWMQMMRQFSGLHVWGYTAHARDSAMGKCIALLGELFPGRWMFRFSEVPEAPVQPMQATTVWRTGGQAEASMSPPRPETDVICPAQLDKSQACTTCGLCWSGNAQNKRVVFIGHGMNRRQ